ncbi:MAG: FxsA family protein [Amaricoccus sp.]
MAKGLLLIFLAVPLIEVALFVQVGSLIGVLPTVMLCILSAVVGTAVMRTQGLASLDRLRSSLEAGGDPRGPIAHGALILVAGMLLIVPGFFTDAIGLLLLLPPVRRQLIRWGASRVTVKAAGYVRPQRQRAAGAGDAIDVEYEIVESASPVRRGTSGWTRPQS